MPECLPALAEPYRYAIHWIFSRDPPLARQGSGASHSPRDYNRKVTAQQKYLRIHTR